MSMESKDWADLLPDLIELISQKLSDVTDFVRFRSVCKNWRSSAPLSNPPPQLPWLLECNERDWKPTRLKDDLRFYSLSTQTIGSISLKYSHKFSFYPGPCSGYIFSLSSCGPLFLWNPLTNAEIYVSLSRRHSSGVFPVWSGSDQILNQRTVFGTVVNGEPCLAVYHPVNMKWNLMKGSFCGFCYSNGMFFTTDMEGNTVVLDEDSQKSLYKVSSPNLYLDACRPDIYHVELSGEVMRVHYYYRRFGRNVDEFCFHLYKLSCEERNGQPCWVKVSDIGDHVVFLDSKKGFALKAPIDGFKGNCIYCFAWYNGIPCKYDITTGTIESLPCPFSACTWFVPSLS